MTKIFYSEGETTVIEALKTKPGSTIASLIVATQASRTTVRNALIKAQANGNVIVSQEWPRRHTWLDIPLAPVDSAPSTILTPDVVQPGEVAKRFSAGRPNIVKALNGVNFEKQDRQTILDTLEAVGKAVLGLYVALSHVEDGPEWRQEAGV